LGASASPTLLHLRIVAISRCEDVACTLFEGQRFISDKIEQIGSAELVSEHAFCSADGRWDGAIFHNNRVGERRGPHCASVR